MKTTNLNTFALSNRQSAAERDPLVFIRRKNAAEMQGGNETASF